eukprot:973954-Prymnesium_polylepis.1
MAHGLMLPTRCAIPHTVVMRVAERDSKTRKARTPPRHVTRCAMPRTLHALPSGQRAQHPPGT